MEVKYSKGTGLIINHTNRVFPKTDRMLSRHQSIYERMSGDGSERISDRYLIRDGSIFALYPGVNSKSYLKFITTFHEIGRYINLLITCKDEFKNDAFISSLFVSFRDAVDCKRKMNNLLNLKKEKYMIHLNRLVEECRFQVIKPHSYSLAMGFIKKYVQFYTDLHILSYSDRTVRENRLLSWTEKYKDSFPDVSAWEFCSAAGSSLLTFVLFALSYDKNLTPKEIENTCNAYFPWICGLQTTLGQFINSQQDIMLGELNFTYYYKNLKECEERLSFFIEKSFESCNTLKYPEFHKTMIKRMISMYLSDPLASSGMNKIASANLLKIGGDNINLYYNLYKIIRFFRLSAL